MTDISHTPTAEGDEPAETEVPGLTRHFTTPPSFEVEQQLRRSMEFQHERRQHEGWELVFRHLSERERASAFAHYGVEMLWDRLDEDERDQVLSTVEANKTWPGTFDRMAEEKEREWNEAAEEERIRVEEVRAAQAALLDQTEQVLQSHRELEEAQRLLAEQREREEREERERRIEEAREGLGAESKENREAAGKA